jgi:hypothetical protein
MLSATPTEALKADVLDVIKPLISARLVSKEKVTRTIDSAMQAISDQARTGATKGARRQITPLLVGALLVSGVAGVLAITAIVHVRKRRS